MAAAVFPYDSPLKGYENRPPLSDERVSDDVHGKHLKNPEPEVRSEAYDRFVEPLDNGRRGGFDVHIYHFQANPAHAQFARELWQRIRLEFPELRVYTFWDRPLGPHPVAMFEVSLQTPAQFGALVPWLAVHRGPLSVLVHPNTVEPGVEAGAREERNHTERALWMGERLPLDLTLFRQRSAGPVKVG